MMSVLVLHNYLVLASFGPEERKTVTPFVTNRSLDTRFGISRSRVPDPDSESVPPHVMYPMTSQRAAIGRSLQWSYTLDVKY